MNTPAPFDAIADRYDDEFTDHPLGQALRRLTWRHASMLVAPRRTLLDLGCGTGEDALWLAQGGARVLAVDVAPRLLEVARVKAAARELSDRVVFRQVDLGSFLAHELDPPWPGCSAFDGVWSNFGALNCVPDRTALGHALAERTRSGAPVVLVVMNRVCLLDLTAGLLRLRAGGVWRRRDGAVVQLAPGVSQRVWFPGARRLRRELGPRFRPWPARGVGCLVPPTDWRRGVERHPRLLARLERADPLLGGWWPARALADHTVLRFERR